MVISYRYLGMKLLAILFLGFFHQCEAYGSGEQQSTCKAYEREVNCVNLCNTCKDRGKCAQEYGYCTRGCDCIEGYFRDSSGNCVEAKNCNSYGSGCPKNERYSYCASTCNDCWTRGECDTSYCTPGCDCIYGFYRDNHGHCVPERQCDILVHTCGENEAYSECVCPCNDCRRRCNCRYSCESGCDCKEGHYRNSSGICIPSNQCVGEPAKNYAYECGHNEVYYDCVPTCQNSCDTYFQSTAQCVQFCYPGCFCKLGYVKRRDGLCVLPNECHNTKTCGVYEEYSSCGSACPATCENLGKSVMCIQKCVEGCFCQRDYVRGFNGSCIRAQDCPKVERCKEREEFKECGPVCQPSCDDQKRDESQSTACVRGCFCNYGLVRDNRGECISPEHCPSKFPVCYDPYEAHKICGCERTCDNQIADANCSPANCRSGCFCTEGYVRDTSGRCILPTQCPVVCIGAYEMPKICGCERTCDNQTADANCSPANCRNGCFCTEGYVRDTSGKCILPTNCPVVCKENEKYDNCSCHRTCQNKTTSCTACEKDCFCISGFVKDPDSGKCIPEQQCPPVCKENAKYDNCSCHRTCQNKTTNCTACEKDCFCVSGFVKDPDSGKCISEQQCPPECKEENEEHKKCDCHQYCLNPTKAENCTSNCVEGCFCKDGFLRDESSKKCIPKDDCPWVCPENETFERCGCNRTCDNQTVGDCASPNCTKGCVCKDGFLRDSSQKCIVKEECPWNCPENETFNNCGCQQTCQNKTEEAVVCPPTPCYRGCFCKDGLVRDLESKNCIPKDKCLVVCPENETFNKCSCHQNCGSTSGQSDCNSNNCKEGCFCNEGFLRDPSTNKCVRADICPIVCAENEYLDNCGDPCQKTCKTRNKSHSCMQFCFKGCFCKPGFVRQNKTCIPEEQCPREICKDNEQFEECGNVCQPTCDNRDPGPKEKCPIPCVSGCFCKKGFVKTQNGSCIPVEKCPPGHFCGKHEVFKRCASPCQPTCDMPVASADCKPQCFTGCFCKDGYVRNAAGVCVRPDQCLAVCGPNEEFSRCGSFCQPTCDMQVPSADCPNPCQKGCFCKKDYVRDISGKCIKPDECPKIELCPKQYEKFHHCGPSCIATCGRLEPRRNCVECIRGCFCDANYVRDIKGNCILRENCPKEPEQCPYDEEFFMCMPNCRHTCEEYFSFRPKACEQICRPGCFCQRGYIRRSDGKCVEPFYCSASSAPTAFEGRRMSNEDDDFDESTTKTQGNANTAPTQRPSTASLVTRSNDEQTPTSTPIRSSTPTLNKLHSSITPLTKESSSIPVPTVTPSSSRASIQASTSTRISSVTESAISGGQSTTPKSTQQLPLTVTSAPTSRTTTELNKKSVKPPLPIIAHSSTESPKLQLPTTTPIDLEDSNPVATTFIHFVPLGRSSEFPPTVTEFTPSELSTAKPDTKLQSTTKMITPESTSILIDPINEKSTEVPMLGSTDKSFDDDFPPFSANEVNTTSK